MADDVRDLGFLAWKNDLAWMERQKGKQWNTAVSHEISLFKNSLRGLSIREYKKDLQSKNGLSWNWKGWTIEGTEFSHEQIWKKGSFVKKCWAADISKNGKWFAAAVQDSDGFERFSVELYTLGSKIQRRKIIRHCGPNVFFYNMALIYLGSSKDIRYDSVRSWDPQTQIDSEVYRLVDPTENLELGRGEDGSIYVLATDFVNTRFGFIRDTDILWKVKKAKDIFVVSYTYWILNQRSPFSDDILESISLEGGWAVTRSYGIRRLWSISDSKPSVMITVWGEIHFDSREPTRLSITDIRYEPYIVYTDTWKISNPRPYPFPITQYQHPAPSFVVYPDSHQDVKALLVIVYSAYGIPTQIGHLVEQWRPLLLRGWAIAAVCLPGSGDHDTKWKESGQRENRKIAIDLLRDAVISLQEELNVSHKHTCLYGRSAGGLLVISTAILYPRLASALYVESPYVDLLRTISNTKLPLTDLETKEFGTGTRALNILASQEWSPMEHIPAEGFPEIFVVARSDLHDLEVFPYEVIKWIQRMRGSSQKGQKKLLYIDRDKGHFATTAESRAVDMALLDAWRISPDGMSEKNSAPRRKNRSTKYKMARRMSRKSRKATRKSRKDRKNKNAAAPMMGGRRRRGTRRGRRGTRRH